MPWATGYQLEFHKSWGIKATFFSLLFKAAPTYADRVSALWPIAYPRIFISDSWQLLWAPCLPSLLIPWGNSDAFSPGSPLLCILSLPCNDYFLLLCLWLMPLLKSRLRLAWGFPAINVSWLLTQFNFRNQVLSVSSLAELIILYQAVLKETHSGRNELDVLVCISLY